MIKKIKSSALLIAIVVGVILTSAVSGVALLVNENTQMSGQSRDDKAAYRAALSGIEDGLLRYKIARSQNQQSDLYETLSNNYIISGGTGMQKVSYDLLFRSSSITVGGSGDLKQSLKIDDTLDIDLNYFIKQKDLAGVTIYFRSIPYIFDRRGRKIDVAGSFTALNYKLVDLSKSYEEQLLREGTNQNSSASSMSVTTAGCSAISSNCHLRIKPQSALSVISNDARRISGSTDAAGGKLIDYALEGRDSGGDIIKPTDPVVEKPGLVIIESVGIAGQARRRIEARIDASNGTYLGIFDYGVYCGDRCNWGTNGL